MWTNQDNAPGSAGDPSQDGDTIASFRSRQRHALLFLSSIELGSVAFADARSELPPRPSLKQPRPSRTTATSGGPAPIPSITNHPPQTSLESLSPRSAHTPRFGSARASLPNSSSKQNNNENNNTVDKLLSLSTGILPNMNMQPWKNVSFKGNTRLFSNSKYTASPSTFSPDANADTIIPITASAAATELADTPPAIASSSASNNPSKDIELEIVVLGGPSTEDVNTKSASDPRGALAKPAFGSRLRLDNLVAVVSKRSSSPSGSSIGQPKNKGIIPAPDISSPSDPRLSLDSPTPISPVSTAKRSRSVDQPTDRVEPLAVTLAPFRIRSGTTGGAKFTPFDSSSPPSRRLSPWRLFDNASDPHSASSSPIRYDGAGAFLVSKSLVAYEGRKSLTGRGGRVVEVLKLHDGGNTPSRKKNESRSSTASGTALHTYSAGNSTGAIVRTLANSVGELVNSTTSGLFNVFRVGGASSASGGAAGAISGEDAPSHFVSAFENGVRAGAGMRESMGSMRRTVGEGRNANTSNGSLGKAGPVERKGSLGVGASIVTTQVAGVGGVEEEFEGVVPYPGAARSRENTMDMLMNSKIVLMGPQGGYPVVVFSVIASIEKRPKETKRNTKSLLFGSQPFADRLGLAFDAVKRKPKVESYIRHVEPTGLLGSIVPDYDTYNPLYLDDPELKTGKHRTVIKLPFFVSSIFLYSRPEEIKRELNEHFRETHPTVDPQITLSQIRNLKSRMVQVGLAQDMELSSVALAFVYMEKLVLKNFVGKLNRRLIASVCLLLAAKVNDPKETKYNDLLQHVEEIMEVPAKEVYQQEFAVYAALEFNLYIPLWQLVPHLERIIEASDYKSVDDYLGGRTFFAVKA